MLPTYWFRTLPSIATLFIAAYALSAGATGINDAKKSAKPRPHRHTPAATALAGPVYAERAEVMQAADDIAQRYAMDPQWVRNAIGQARYQASVARGRSLRSRSSRTARHSPVCRRAAGRVSP